MSLDCNRLVLIAPVCRDAKSIAGQTSTALLPCFSDSKLRLLEYHQSIASREPTQIPTSSFSSGKHHAYRSLCCFYAHCLLPTRCTASRSGSGDRQVYPLWPNGAPGSESRKDEPETSGDWWVANIHHPTLTAFIPEPDKRNGTSLIICPGGGHSKLVFTAEVPTTAKYLMERGFSCFVLKYRLGREEKSGYAIDKTWLCRRTACRSLCAPPRGTVESRSTAHRLVRILRRRRSHLNGYLSRSSFSRRR